jgi:hypothetical protein
MIIENNFLVHCGKKTRVVNTRNAIRVRVCRVCGQRFKTEEILVDFKKSRKREKLKGCPVTKRRLEEMMADFPSLHALAGVLNTSDTTLKRWLQEYDL